MVLRLPALADRSVGLTRAFVMAVALCAVTTASPAGAGAQPADPDSVFLDDIVMRQRHALPQSRFATIDGETIHYVDEGKGPAILLLHGSFASLRQWDSIAAALKDHYRVIRFDMPPAGLSGPSPVHDYTLDHGLALIDGLMDRLGIRRFAMIGTSSSGLPTTAYAATRPERVSAMVLINIAIARPRFDLASQSRALQDAVAEDRTHPGFHRPEFWRQILLANIVDKRRVTPDLVRQWTDLNHRSMRDPAIGRAIAAQLTPFTRSAEDLAKISVPTLLLWGAEDHETSLAQHGLPAFSASAAADKALVVIPGCGHMMPLDCPDQALERTLPFLQRTAGK